VARTEQLVRSAVPPGASLDVLQERVRVVPGDAGAWARLGSAYVEEARVTADPALYPKADGSFDRSLGLAPRANDAALAGKGALANARHQFAEGQTWAQKAIAANPTNPIAYGVLGDSQLELGRYDEAFATFQRMLGLGTTVASYSRASYAREIQGDVPGATRLFELALQTATAPADAAFANYYLGELAWGVNRLADAERFWRRAAALDAAYMPPRAGLARLQWARGDADGAIAAYQAVVGRYPVPQYVNELGDLYLTTGRPAPAQQQYDLLRAQQRLLQANGVNIDLELSLFSADHGVDLEAGLVAARSEFARRKSIAVADALAWQLHANHRDAEALDYANRALALGTENPLFLFHRGVIQQALGHNDDAGRDSAAALALNPHFSILHAQTAAEVVRSARSGH
jgi:tetratricopeptide (TPR) repeat protein